MKKTLLMTTAAAALIFAGGVAGAQDMKGGSGENSGGATRAPAAQQSAPAEKIAPNMKAGHRSQTTGQGSSESKEMNAKPDEKSGMSGKSSGPGEKSGARTESQKGSKTTGAATEDTKSKSSESKSSEKSSDNMKSRTNEKGPANDSKSAHDSKSSAQTDSTTRGGAKATTGQGAAGAHAKLTTEQRTKVTTVIKRQRNVRPVEHVNFNISVGVHVPRTLHFYPLPTEVISVYPAWRGYEFILVGDQIVVINPRTLEIVDVIAA